jgi:hypothetical protein
MENPGGAPRLALRHALAKKRWNARPDRSEGASWQAETPRRGVLIDWLGAAKRGLTFELTGLRRQAP